ncbi:YcaO-like family protein [Achromobacter insuavis]
MHLDLPHVWMPGSLLRGDSLQCRLPARTLSLNAPARVLRALHEFDGTLAPRIWLQRREREGWHADSITSLLRKLIDEGALVSTLEAPRHWWSHAENPRFLGEQPDARTVHDLMQSAQRRLTASPMADAITIESSGPGGALRATVPARIPAGFGGAPVDASTLTSILWAAAGIVADTEGVRATSPPQERSIPAIFVNLRAAVTSNGSLSPASEGLPAGIYQLAAGFSGRLHFIPIDADLSYSCAAFSSPHLLDQAQGVLVIAGDFAVSAAKYGSRALSYLPLEAGHAAQNALLTAAASNCHAVEIGGFIERKLGRLLHLPATTVPLTTVFLGPPGPETPAEGQFDWVELTEADDAGFHLCRARQAPSHPWSWGRDTRPDRARLKALMESRERAALLRPRDLVMGRWRDIPGAVHPADVLCYSANQYRRLSFPYRRFDATAAYGWKAAQDIFADSPCFMLADLVYLEEALAGLERPPAYTSGNTSGVASHVSIEAALENAVLELIERDAFMRFWLGQRAYAVREQELPRALRIRLRRMRAEGLQVELRRLASPIARWHSVSRNRYLIISRVWPPAPATNCTQPWTTP